MRLGVAARAARGDDHIELRILHDGFGDPWTVVRGDAGAIWREGVCAITNTETIILHGRSQKLGIVLSLRHHGCENDFISLLTVSTTMSSTDD